MGVQATDTDSAAKADDMSIEHFVDTVVSPARAIFESPERCTDASYEGELAKHKCVECSLLREKNDEKDELIRKLVAWREIATNHIAGLTPRQRQIMDMVLAGHPNKNIAVDLGISRRTVENHRASIMRKTGSKSLPALVRLALAAA